MSDTRALELSLRRLTDAIGDRSKSHASQAASGVASEAATRVGEDLATHVAARQFVHGVGPLYVAKTKNATQYIDWSEIENKPTVFPGSGGAIDPTTLELDGGQITTGTVNINRLPVATTSAPDPFKLVRSDDPRLQSSSFTLAAETPVYRGRFVTASSDNACSHASAAGPLSAAIGYVADDYGMGAQATIWRSGGIAVFLVDADLAALMEPVYLAEDGLVTRIMPMTPGGVIQQVGHIIGLSGGGVRVSVMIDIPVEVL